MSILENLTPLAVWPKDDRLKRFDIVCLNEKTSPGTGKEVIAENIRQEEVAQRIVARVNACAGIPDSFLKPGIVAEQGIEAQQLIRKVEHFQELAAHRSKSIDNLMNIQGKLTSEREQLLAALENAHNLILSFREEEISYFEKGTGFYDHEKELAAHDAEYSAAIATAKGGAA